MFVLFQYLLKDMLHMLHCDKNSKTKTFLLRSSGDYFAFFHTSPRFTGSQEAKGNIVHSLRNFIKGPPKKNSTYSIKMVRIHVLSIYHWSFLSLLPHSWEFPPGHGTCMVLASVANDTKRRWEHASNAWKNGKISRYFTDMVSTHLS